MQTSAYSSAGLRQQEVQERVRRGLVNRTDAAAGKSVKEIVLSNTVTYFNLIFLVLTVLLCIAQSFRNLTFLPVVIGNTLVGIVQELRAKRVLDKMSLLNAPHTVVVRDGRRQRVRSEDLVQDDLVLFAAGDQIAADARVVDGEVLVNEALLTGESDEIAKAAGAKLLSGSFVVSGKCLAVLERVGNASYIAKLTAEAKKTKEGEPSEMIRAINRIVLFMGVLLIPIGCILFYQSYFVKGELFADSVASMVAAVIGMIPEGLYLLTTVALALGTMRLARRHVLLNDMKSIEALARVDMLCVDKTGTITEPDMQVQRVIPVGDTPPAELTRRLAQYAAASPDGNATMAALRAYCDGQTSPEPRTPRAVLPFSSAVKYGAVTFADGVWVLGAPDFVLAALPDEVAEEVGECIRCGYRVLVLAHQREPLGDAGLSPAIRPLGFVVLANAIRENAPATFAYFHEQGVEVKVISGDHPQTVAEIARVAGIAHADQWVDASTWTDDAALEAAAGVFTVFGRVTPRQKQKLVRALQRQGHTVAMTGDGVNDILALKDADCSIAMASGSEAVSQAAQVVLMDSDFAHMPDVVAEGRRVVNNIQRSASLFLVKNIFSLLLSITASVLMLTYPLEPAHISLISMFTIGLPGFLLALESNHSRIDGRFGRNVWRRALPAGLVDAILVGSLAIFGQVFSLPRDDVATASTLVLAFVGFMILWHISRPLNGYRIGVFVFNILGMVLCFAFLPDLFGIVRIPVTSIHLTVLFTFAAESLFRLLT